MQLHRLPLALLVASGLALGASACTAPGTASTPTPSTSASSSPSPSDAASASASPDPSATASWTPSPSASASVSPSPPPGQSESPAAAPTPSDRTASAGPIQVPSGTVEELHLVDAFLSEGFVEGTYQPVGRPEAVRAMAAQLDRTSAALEFRLNQSSGRMTVEVSQDILSASSNQTVDVVLLADGRQVATKTVGFKQSATLSANLGGVAALRVQATAKGGATTVLVTRVTVQG